MGPERKHREFFNFDPGDLVIRRGLHGWFDRNIPPTFEEDEHFLVLEYVPYCGYSALRLRTQTIMFLDTASATYEKVMDTGEE